MRYGKPILTSIIVHALLMFMLSKGGADGDGNGSGKVPQDNITVKIIDKPNDTKIKEEKPKDGKLLVKQIKKKIKNKPKEIECDDSFIGIGVEHQWGSCLVSKVYAGYPAEANGILPGDLIISPPCLQIRDTKISRIDMVIMRGTQAIHLSFMRGKICGTK